MKHFLASNKNNPNAKSLGDLFQINYIRKHQVATEQQTFTIFGAVREKAII